ncbi:hypothetical protein MLD38_012235 [Melastoma candidum]|uniref:Uncharacterized protein n=1 Tax=Melastoma candidum TaxID=119954 RepID=A0ACB9R5N8_9MYRT|nr:hypothetical protein MLD38_012235 [Melastoma candidum]
MCILCVIQKWTRRVAAMLPWLVIPLIGLWALSKLLPPDYRFEITSPRLACVIVLLVTLFWYEILMPKLSAWRAQRNAHLRERQKNEAIELQKLRKTATRRCRNCKTPYKDQNPGGGKFMCLYCGHVSKRPVLELPISPGMGMSNSGFIKELVGKGGKLLNGRVWSDNGWMCSQDWLENGGWVGGPFPSKSDPWGRNGNRMFGGDDRCLTEKPYLGFLVCGCKLLTSFIMIIRWLWRKIFRNGSVGEDVDFDAESRRILAQRDGENFHESRSERARRKAEEKRQARLERELLEEEERKQRQEVARLVEERRKLRDEKVEAEKKSTEKGSSPTKEKDRRKEVEKKRQERKKERDRGSSKSNSDAEEIERRVNKESDRKQDSDKKGLPDCYDQKSATESLKGPTTDIERSFKSASGTNVSHVTAGSRYLDRMKGSFLSSSKAFGGGSFFGRSVYTPAIAQKESKPVVAQSHGHTSLPKREYSSPEHVVGKTVSNMEDRKNNCSGALESRPLPEPKKSWHQLFTRSSSTSNNDSLKKANSKSQEEVRPLSPGHSFSGPLYSNPISFGLVSPFSLPSHQSNVSSSSLGFSQVVEPTLPRIGEKDHELMPEEAESFEDPCYVPDPIALLGPVSESLDNFQLDIGHGFYSDLRAEKALVRKKVVSPEHVKPSPIESPLSRLRGIDDLNPRFCHAPGNNDVNNFPVEDAVPGEQRAWQVWDSTPLFPEDLSLITRPADWLLNTDQSGPAKQDFMLPSSQIRATSLFVEDPSLPHIHSSSCNGGPFSPLSASNDRDPWVQKALIPPLLDGDSRMPRVPVEETTQNEIFFGSATKSGLVQETRPATANFPSSERPMQGSGEVFMNKAPGAGRNVGGSFPLQMYSFPGDLVDRKK